MAESTFLNRGLAASASSLAAASSLSLPKLSRFRSMTPSPSSSTARPEPPNTLYKAKSIAHLPTMSTAATSPRGRSAPFDRDSDYLNTLPDPRTPSPAPPRSPSADSTHHPDLSSEVAMLSTKLINAINHQTSLDDSLQQSRQELDAARRRVAELEAQAKEHYDMLAAGLLLKKADVDATLKRMADEVTEARKQKDTSDKAKRQMDGEIEQLTSVLFEEANEMVAAARKETEATERKNAQLRSQLADTELLLASQQEQLHDLKGVMEKMSSERDETETMPHSSTAPSTPGIDTANKMGQMFDSIPMSPNASGFGDVAPDHPLRFSHLLTPVMRSDVQSYNDFAELLKTSRAVTQSHSRNSSGLALTNGNGSNSSIPSAASSSPIIPGSFSSGPTSSPRDSPYAATLPALKDNKFYKRCLVEDIEPTLRLDLAPGLSWLARRTVIGSITSGALVVEPFIPQSRFYGNAYACSLCGESRRTEAHARRHRFRTSFLRMVRDGLWRARTEDDVKGAWEESVRLRERMFWARLGGGVVPAVVTRPESPPAVQHRAEESKEDGRDSEDSRAPSLEVPRVEDPFRSRGKQQRVSIGARIIERTSSDAVNTSDRTDFAPSNLSQVEVPTTPTGADEQVYKELQDASRPQSRMTIIEPSEVVLADSQEADTRLTETKSEEFEDAVETTLSPTAVPGSFE
ncbi:hypothetical protein MBLNU459_g7495t1 [Dothideomycetes sp. NU459]